MTGRIHFDTLVDFATCVGVDFEQLMHAWCNLHYIEQGIERETLLQNIVYNDDVSVRDNFFESILESMAANGSLSEDGEAVVELQSDGGVDIVITYTESEVRHLLDPYKKIVLYKR